MRTQRTWQRSSAGLTRRGGPEGGATTEVLALTCVEGEAPGRAYRSG